MPRNPVAQTAFGPMVLAAIEQNEPPGRRLVDDDLAELFLPCRTAIARRRDPVGAGAAPDDPRVRVHRSRDVGQHGLRKRFIDDKLHEALADVDAVVILGAGLDTRAYRLNRQARIPVFEVDQPVNIALKAKTVRRVLGGPALVGSVGGVGF